MAFFPPSRLRLFKEENKKIIFHFLPKRYFWDSSLSPEQRIGPHSEHIYSSFFGHFLGSGSLDRRITSTRLSIHAASSSCDYIHWLHEFYASRGYCSLQSLKIKSRSGRGEQYFSTNIHTFSFVTFNDLYSTFYKPVYDARLRTDKFFKCIPYSSIDYLTPCAIAFWIMSSAIVRSFGLQFFMRDFDLDSISVLCRLMLDRYGVRLTYTRRCDDFVIFFPWQEIHLIKSFLLPYIHQTMLYKLRKS